MYVCICNAITEQQILDARQQGFNTISEITQSLGVGAGCGKCLEKAEDLLMENTGVQHFNPNLNIIQSQSL